VYAIDLPGYGFSDRSDRRYLPELMAAAIDALVSKIRAAHDDLAIDALAVSLSSEYLARAALERPAAYRSLALVSSTGFDRRSTDSGSPEENRGRESVYRFVSAPLLGQGLFKLLTSRASIRFFLQKTWGRKEIDEEMFEYACLTARQPGAHHAPFHFLSGFLFGANPLGLFQKLDHPTWLSHGVRGDFTDFRRVDRVSHKSNWHVTEFATGALPYFERTEQFVGEYDAFMNVLDSGPALEREPSVVQSREA
jgi:pimeloyl-ACP methyl ester carboxylesterase